MTLRQLVEQRIAEWEARAAAGDPDAECLRRWCRNARLELALPRSTSPWLPGWDEKL